MSSVPSRPCSGTKRTRPSSVMLAAPWSGWSTDTTVRPGSSPSVSLVRTSTTMSWSTVVLAMSSRATGKSFTALTVMATVRTWEKAVPSETR